MRNKSKTIEDYFYFIGNVLLIVVLIFVFVHFKQAKFLRFIKFPPCLFHLLTGFYCPGCGGTRAVKALLHGRIIQSFYYHPIVFYGTVIYACFMITQTIERFSSHHIRIGMRYHNGYVLVMAAIIIVNFLIKNIWHYCYGFSM